MRKAKREKKKETKEKSNVYSTWIYTGSDGSPSVTKSGLSRVPLESYNTQQGGHRVQTINGNVPLLHVSVSQTYY